MMETEDKEKHLKEESLRSELDDKELLEVAGGTGNIKDLLQCKTSLIAHCPNSSIDAIKAYCNTLVVVQGRRLSSPHCP